MIKYQPRHKCLRSVSITRDMQVKEPSTEAVFSTGSSNGTRLERTKKMKESTLHLQPLGKGAEEAEHDAPTDDTEKAPSAPKKAMTPVFKEYQRFLLQIHLPTELPRNT